jgi:hypothetical protein
LAQLPKSCDTVVHAFSTNSSKLQAAREELCNTRSELVTPERLIEILFDLLEKMCGMVRTHEVGKDMKRAQAQGEEKL